MIYKSFEVLTDQRLQASTCISSHQPIHLCLPRDIIQANCSNGLSEYVTLSWRCEYVLLGYLHRVQCLPQAKAFKHTICGRIRTLTGATIFDRLS